MKITLLDFGNRNHKCVICSECEGRQTPGEFEIFSYPAKGYYCRKHLMEFFLVILTASPDNSMTIKWSDKDGVLR